MPHFNARRPMTASIRALIASTLGNPNMTLVTVPVSGRQLKDVVEYDIAPMPNNGNGVEVVVIDFNKIEGGLDQDMTIEQAQSLISGMLEQAIKSSAIDMPINVNDLLPQIKAKIEQLFDGKTTITLSTIVNHLRNVRVSRSYGSWRQVNKTKALRFVAAVMGWINGLDWVNTNFSKFVATKDEKPAYGLAIYAYDINQLTQTGQPMSVAIPTATPVAIGVLGFYPNSRGGCSFRYVGSMPALPMVTDGCTASPMFIRHDAGAVATRKLIDAIKAGYGDANTLFAKQDGPGSFTFTRELLEMSRRNPTVFIINLGIAVAYTNDHKNVVKDLVAKRNAYSAAWTDLQETLGRDYSTIPSSSGFSSAFGTSRTNRGTGAPNGTTERELVTVGSAPSFAGAFGTSERGSSVPSLS